ncbi:hypothetical protein Dda_0339 [Drechslerella dactyloides]|uniref:Uncharacterized protein n=1 Tax=Drechslerella dactyloides TaxID=74499 RepID=A0AAD6J7R9_DREDA|nr:hypothetical protein Dda_0339 [Drechslerella dactyloides]
MPPLWMNIAGRAAMPVFDLTPSEVYEQLRERQNAVKVKRQEPPPPAPAGGSPPPPADPPAADAAPPPNAQAAQPQPPDAWTPPSWMPAGAQAAAADQLAGDAGPNSPAPLNLAGDNGGATKKIDSNHGKLHVWNTSKIDMAAGIVSLVLVAILAITAIVCDRRRRKAKELARNLEATLGRVNDPPPPFEEKDSGGSAPRPSRIMRMLRRAESGKQNQHQHLNPNTGQPVPNYTIFRVPRQGLHITRPPPAAGQTHGSAGRRDMGTQSSGPTVGMSPASERYYRNRRKQQMRLFGQSDTTKM